jgi:DnaJ-class molecular chaperone
MTMPSIATESGNEQIDLYKELQLPKTCSTQDIKRQFRKLALQYHPGIQILK